MGQAGLRGVHAEELRIEVVDPVDDAGVEEEAAPGVLLLTVTDLDAAAALLPAVVSSLGLLLRRLEPRETSLEDVFVGLVGGGR
ncbi:hypothetical protein ACWGSU_14035 [Streptomyces koyangensis]